MMKTLAMLLGVLALTAAFAQAQCKSCGCAKKCNAACECKAEKKDS